MSTFLYLTEEKVKELLKWDEIYEAIKQSMKATSEEKVSQPRRAVTSLLGTKNVLYSMPGYLQDENFGSLACKMVSSFPDNSKIGVPTIQANVLLFNETTGALEAVISGTELTKWRTASASMVATKALFTRCDQKGLIFGIFGAGNQAEIHGEAFLHFFDCKLIKIWNYELKDAERLAEKLNTKHGTNVFQSVPTGEECAKDTDVFLTATFATSPILEASWVKDDVHINAIGVSGTMAKELDENLYRKGDVYCDSLENLQSELPGLIELGIPIKGEIGEILSGKKTLEGKKVTIFQSLGMPVEDCAAAKLMLNLYKKKTCSCAQK